MSYSLRRRRVPMAVTAAAAAALLGLAGCGSADSTTTTDPGPSASAPAASDTASALTVHDAWVKAADGGMTGAFGVLVNAGDEPVNVVSAASDISPVELHEHQRRPRRQDVDAQKEGGFVDRGPTRLALEPGGDHLMLMKLTRPVQAGEEVDLHADPRRRADRGVHRGGQAVHRGAGELRPEPRRERTAS